MSKVLFEDKVAVNPVVGLEINNVTAENLTELKASVNALYDIFGGAFYQDNEASDIVVDTNSTLITINKLGEDTDEQDLPPPIRGTGTLWDGSKITPIAARDEYDFRLGFTVVVKSGNPTRITFSLDIGDEVTPTIIIGEQSVNVEKTAPFPNLISFPIYVRATFLANGGKFFAKTDTGSVTIRSRNLFIKRDYAAV